MLFCPKIFDIHFDLYFFVPTLDVFYFLVFSDTSNNFTEAPNLINYLALLKSHFCIILLYLAK